MHAGRPIADEPLISFLIKAFNEEAKIGRCIESVLAAGRDVPNRLEIIVADSLSTDGTVDVARRYPVKVVQLADARDRGCGAGLQLAYQHSSGALVYVLDGDMELCPTILPAALRRLREDPSLAGVAGLLIDRTTRNIFDRYRVTRPSHERWLSGGGLYRRDAIEECGGYAANRNLKGWEEAELGMRLTRNGWRLERLDVPGVLHTGHASGTLTMLRSHWCSRRAMAYGVLLRQAFSKPWFGRVLALLLQPLLVLAMWAVVATCVVVWAWTGDGGALGITVAMVLAALALFAMHKRSLTAALTSFGLWHFYAASIVVGLAESQRSPTEAIDCVVVAGGRSSMNA